MLNAYVLLLIRSDTHKTCGSDNLPVLNLLRLKSIPYHSSAWLKHTVKLVYKDRLRDQQNVVLIHRWSLYVGSITWKIYPWGPVQCGLYKQVVFIQVVFRARLTQIDRVSLCISIGEADGEDPWASWTCC